MYVLLKALPPVCVKYTAQGESRVANIAQGKAHETLTKSCILYSGKVWWGESLANLANRL